MKFHLKSAAFGLAGLAALAIPTSSAFADGWGHGGYGGRHHSTYGGYSHHQSHGGYGYSSRGHYVPQTYARTYYAAPVVRERVIVRSNPTYVTEYPRTVIYSGGSYCR